jgi:hypothetical protein
MHVKDWAVRSLNAHFRVFTQGALSDACGTLDLLSETKLKCGYVVLLESRSRATVRNQRAVPERIALISPALFASLII